MKHNKIILKHTLILISLQYLTAIIVIYFVNFELDYRLFFIINILFYSLIFFIPIFLFIKHELHVKFLSYMNFNTNGILIGFAVSAFIALVFLISSRFTINIGIIDSKKILILIGAVLAGLFEEITFRGFYLESLKMRVGFGKANLITAFLFAALHFQKILLEGPIQLIMLFIIGLWLGYVYEKTKSIWVPIIIHSVYNILIILI